MSDTIVTKMPLTLLDVDTYPNLRLDIVLRYTDSTLNKKVRLERGTKYEIIYLTDGELHKVVGKIMGVGKILRKEADGYPKYATEYLIKVDGSSECGSLIVTMRSSQIRDVKVFIKYADEDTTINTAVNSGGTVTGVVNDVTISNPVIDSGGNISGGDVDNGKPAPSKYTIIGGTSCGGNPNGNTIVVINPTNITGGTIVAGKIIQGTCPDGYTIDPVTGKLTTTMINGAVINNATVKDCTVTGGTVINPVLEGSIVSGGSRSGSDMVTTGATVIGSIATGGVTTGGTLTGGTAVGQIDGNNFIITDGQTTGGKSTGGTVTGGVVSGGTVIGNTTIGATITGGLWTGGTTVNGITSYGTITIGSVVIPGIAEPVDPPSSVVSDDQNMDFDGLIIFDNRNTGVGSNLSTVNL